MEHLDIATKIAKGLAGGGRSAVLALWGVIPADWRVAIVVIMGAAAAWFGTEFAPTLKTYRDDPSSRRLASMLVNVVSCVTVSSAAFGAVAYWQWQTIGPKVLEVAPEFAEVATAVHLPLTFAAPSSCTDQILATISAMESGGDVVAQNGSASASGLYQFVDSTWLGLGGGDFAPTAKQASAAEQTMIARKHVEEILAASNGDVTAVPVVWYWPDALGDPTRMAIVPPWPGNRLTVAEYQSKWMAELPKHGGACSRSFSGAGLALPLPGPASSDWTDSHHDYPAADISAPTGTPIYAMAGGLVVHVTNDAGNCAGNTAGCVDICGIGAVIESNGVRWAYCHMDRRAVELGDTVDAGEQIGTVGNTGHSFGEHLHLGVKVNGTWACPAEAINAASRGEWIDPTQLATSGCTH